MNFKKHFYKNMQTIKHITAAIKTLITKILNKEDSMTLLIIPHVSVKKVRTLKFSTRIISIIVFLNILLISGICAFAVSYNSLNHKLEISNHKYKTLESEKESDKKELDEYKAKDQQAQEKMKKLEDLENELKSIIQSKSTDSQSNAATHYPALASRGMLFTAPDKYHIKSLEDPSTETGSMKDTNLSLDTLIYNISSSIDEYHTVTAAEERARKAKMAMPSLLPVEGIITSKFGYRKNPFGSGYEYHLAVDIASSKGTPIKAAGDGIVIMAGRDTGGYGLLVKIDHKNGYQSSYGHNSKLIVKSGDEVKRGQVIAYIGSTGKSTGTHCHFEVRLNGCAINPLSIK